MIKYIADKIKKIDRKYKIPMSQVVFEEQERISNVEVVVTYVFRDTSSVIIRYTKNSEEIIKKTCGTVEEKLKNLY